MSKLQNELWDQLIAEFPPLWNPQDLCFRDLHVRSQCRQLLLEKANRVSSVPITMESLRKRLRNVNKRLRKGYDQEWLLWLGGSRPSLLASANPDSTQPANRICMRELAAEYPCLWDSSDVNYMNVLMKMKCEEQLLVKYNNLASTPITMVQLREKLQDLRQQWSGETGSGPSLLASTNSDSTRPLVNRICMKDVAAEFPCLWDSSDVNYMNVLMKTKCEEQLLVKYNNLSSTPITMVQLREKLQDLRQQWSGETGSGPSLLASTNPDSTRPLVNRICMKDVAAEYPCLWDSSDVNYMNTLMKTKCEEQLLVKYNNLASTPITMVQLREKLQDLRQQWSGETGSGPSLLASMLTNPDSTRPLVNRICMKDVAAEYPCLWDSSDVNYMNTLMKTKCEEQLLVKYNKLASTPITMVQLREKLQDLRQQWSGETAAEMGCRSEDTRADLQSDLGNSSDSTDQAHLNNQTPALSIVFLRCAVCGEVKSECMHKINRRPYIKKNKTTLTINNLSVELNYGKNATVCRNCDKKLKEMYKFVKLVKYAQDEMNCANVADAITLDDDDSDDQKLIIDSITVTDTEVTPRVSHKRKSEDTPELKKKCRVTIDLNSCNDDRSMDDIAKYRMFKNDGIIVDAKDPEKVLKVIGTGYGEDITFDVKKEIDTDDIHEEVDETGDISTDDDKSNIVIAGTRTCISEDVMKQKEADDILKNEETSKTVTHEEKQNDIDGNGEVVNKEDNRNGIINEHTNNSEITSAAASTSKEPVCVMPKSELIGLVESIVTRMLNK